MSVEHLQRLDSSRSFELPCRPVSSLLRYQADPTIYSADVNFLFLAFRKAGLRCAWR